MLDLNNGGSVDAGTRLNLETQNSKISNKFTIHECLTLIKLKMCFDRENIMYQKYDSETNFDVKRRIQKKLGNNAGPKMLGCMIICFPYIFNSPLYFLQS